VKLIKMFGLAMVAAVAAMAFIGAGTASATAVCKNETHPCTEPYAVGTVIKAVAGSEQKVSLKDKSIFGTTEEKCESTVEGKITKNPGETVKGGQKQAEGMIEKVTFTNCQPECTATAVQLKWRVHINYTTGQDGTMWIGPETRAKEDGTWNNAPGALLEPCTKGSGCTFHAHETQPESFGEKYNQEWVQGAIASGANPTITFNQVQLRPSSFLCGEEGLWSGVYHITEPKPIFISP
jgi:hypothetical protein